MCAEFAKYQVPSPSTDANLTDADRQKMHDDAHKPGRVISDGKGTRIEENIQVRLPAPTPGTVLTRNGKEVVVLADGDVMEVAAAKLAGLFPTSPDIAPQAKSEDQPQQQDQEPQTQPDEGWSDSTVDEVMQAYGPRLAETTMEGLVALGVHGTDELPRTRAEMIASSLGLEPSEVQQSYRTAYAAAVDKADEIVVKAGVEDPSDLYDWLEANDKPRLMDLRDAFARGQVKPLQQAARDYVTKYGSDISARTEARLFEAENEVNGGRLYRDPRGVAMVEFAETGMRMSLKDAHRMGKVKWSER